MREKKENRKKKIEKKHSKYLDLSGIKRNRNESA